MTNTVSDEIVNMACAEAGKISGLVQREAIRAALEAVAPLLRAQEMQGMADQMWSYEDRQLLLDRAAELEKPKP
jgi:hypothetical protein